ncbi:unnamed protein product [marine sediment metagenome]|uniref:Uncharacterized protein n=1 Tax=marine sediment metagenome TaxID=412755 RepID=X1TAC5_9ZZZZ
MLERLLRKGQATKVVNAILEPYLDDKRVVLLDEALHAAIERDPEKTLRKALSHLGLLLFNTAKREG